MINTSELFAQKAVWHIYAKTDIFFLITSYFGPIEIPKIFNERKKIYINQLKKTIDLLKIDEKKKSKH
jgi:hypothetical protein